MLTARTRTNFWHIDSCIYCNHNSWDSIVCVRVRNQPRHEFRCIL